MRSDVRATGPFLDEVDIYFPAERGPNGEPSATDFLNMVLPDLMEQIGEQFDTLPLEPTTPGIRTLSLWTIFGPVTIYTTDTEDDVVHLVALEIGDA